MATPKAIFKHEGEAIDYTPVADVAAGDVIDLGLLVGIAVLDIPAGKMGALKVEGVYAVLKFTGEAVALGAPVYWDAGTSTATGTQAYSEAFMGFCSRAALAGDERIWVKLCPGATLS